MIVEEANQIVEDMETISRKRKFDEEDSGNLENSRQKLQKIEPKVELLDLADELLMEILLKLDSESLHELGL